jgi:hypothetical protein
LRRLRLIVCCPCHLVCCRRINGQVPGIHLEGKLCLSWGHLTGNRLYAVCYSRYCPGMRRS